MFLKRSIKIQLLFFALCFACNNNSAIFPKAENALDAAREFIDGCLKGNFKKASAYMINDAENNKRLQDLEKDYKSKNNTDREEYNNSSIIINQEETLSDSLEIINYKNSFDKVARKVKVVYQNGKWLVDFKYTFNGNL